MEEQPKNLKSVFAAAEAKREALEGSYEAGSPTFRGTLAEAIAGYEECLELIASLAIFSPNESLEDLSTSDLPYLLAHYRLAELYQKIHTSSPAERKRTLRLARAAYERYLHQLDSYALLAPPYAKLLQRYADDPARFSTVSTAGDPTARRNAKIANFKAEKDLRAKLDFLRRQPDYLDQNGADEEAVREVHLANLAFCTHMAFQGLESLNREEEILAQAPEPLVPHRTATVEEEDERRRRASERPLADGYTDRLDQPLQRLQSAFGGGRGPLLARDGKPLQPFTIVGTRAELAAGVFRPGHNLPTMSIDEYLEEERRRGGIIEGGGEASGRRPEPDEDDMDKADAETMKARAWDEFKEDNPRGSGNTLNRG